jgi:hypothetical protein
MEAIHLFLQPIALLSSVGLLLISTVTRIVHAEAMLMSPVPTSTSVPLNKTSKQTNGWGRAIQFLRRSLRWLYVSALLLVGVSVAASVLWLFDGDATWLVGGGSCVAVAFIGLALLSLIRAEIHASHALKHLYVGE